MPILGYLIIILLSARLLGHLAILFRQPAVLGELTAGVILGVGARYGLPGLEGISTDPFVDLLARIGVLVLLFEVGLESTVRDMVKVGLPSVLVATLGVVVPFGLGWGVGVLLLPEHSVYVHVFLGATLCATSVGITARVLTDLGRSQSPEARIILGAAVVDDVLGLVILAIVAGVIQAADAGVALEWTHLFGLVGRTIVFLVGGVVVGSFLSPRVFRVAAHLRGTGILVGLALSFCFLMSVLAGLAGLAPIVGAFVAGLILEPVHYKDLVRKGEGDLEHLLRPIGAFLVPIFFVRMGMDVDVSTFADPGSLVLALVLTAAAILGKQACSLGVWRRGIDRLSIGLGMIPRGEVGLVFASIGLGLTVGDERIIDPSTYSAIVVMVMLTTFVTPPALTWSFRHRKPPDLAEGT
ncbi:MAG: cation:proton antiporter [Deltaproteobacteria bacterium]|nr:cation:proton antiporter [Deltaproteobacteria bacterium]